jgi:hypothetical protein
VIAGTAGGTGAGVRIASPDSRVGGPGDADRNVIGGAGAGVDVVGTGDDAIQGAGDGAIVENNRVGTNAAGTAANANTLGVQVRNNARGVKILNNLLSGNTGAGVSLLVCTDVTIQGNFIGTNAAGTVALPNQNGIAAVGAPHTSILDNLISGNSKDGVILDDEGTIRGNKIGTDVTGDAALGNGAEGIISEGSNLVIEDNVISANGGVGLSFQVNASDYVIRANKIGTSADGTGDLGNGGAGIELFEAPQGFTIGGTGAGDGNVIAFNGGPGVSVETATHNSILGNSIFSNAGLGIDLSGPSDSVGRTPNDADDSDLGANDFQNFPTLAQVTSTGTSSGTIAGSLQSRPNQTYRIEFFSDTEADAEGRTLLGSTNVTTNGSGAATFNVTVNVAIPAGRFVTATATNADGSTSEFSDAAVVGQTDPDIKVVGNGATITDGDETPTGADNTDFGTVVVGGGGGGPVTHAFTITNTGQATLNLTGGGASRVAISGPGASNFTVVTQPGSAIAAGQSSPFEIRFDPTRAGTQTATVTIASNDPDESPFTFAIRGIGSSVAPVPEIEVSGNGAPIASGDTTPGDADATDFSDATVGGAPVSRTFTIANAGESSLTCGGVSFDGTNADQFTVTSQPAANVAAGQQTTFTVRFTPTAAGDKDATVRIISDDGDENPYTFAIRGTGGVTTGAGNDTTPPTAMLPAQQPPATAGGEAFAVIVRYHDDTGIEPTSFDNNDLVVTGPNGFSQPATYLPKLVSQVDPQTWDVTYQVAAPGGSVDTADNGAYSVVINAGQVLDTSGNAVAAGAAGTYTLAASDVNTSLGQFGRVNGKRVKLTYAEPDGTQVTVSLSGRGSGEVFRVADGRAQVNVTSDGAGGKLSITAKGGNGRAEIRDINISGSLKSLTAKTADVDGVIGASGNLGAISLGSASGVTLSTTGAIKSITVADDVTNSQFWSGVRFGVDGRFGGGNDVSDTPFMQGAIGKISVGGAVTGSLFAAGFDPIDDQLFNGNGVIVGGPASVIKSVKIKGAADTATVFAAGKFPRKASIARVKVDPLADPRFDMTP